MSEYYWGYAAAANAHLSNPFQGKKHSSKPHLQSPREKGEEGVEAGEQQQQWRQRVQGAPPAAPAEPAEPPPQKQQQPPLQQLSLPPHHQPPARSNSTSRAVRRPRFRAHARTTSTDSGSSSSRGGHRSSHDFALPAPVPAPAPAPAPAQTRDETRDSSDRGRPAAASRWHHRWASAAATRDIGIGRSTRSPSSPLHLHSPTDWAAQPPSPADFTPTSAPASPIPAASGLPFASQASAPAPVPAAPRPRLLQKPSPVITTATAPAASTAAHNHHHHQSPNWVPTSPLSPSGRHRNKQLPATPRNGDTRQSERSHVSSPPHSPASAASVFADDHHYAPKSGTGGTSDSSSIAALAATPGAAIPRSVTSPTRASFSQRITQHLSDRRQHHQHHQHHQNTPPPQALATATPPRRLHVNVSPSRDQPDEQPTKSRPPHSKHHHPKLQQREQHHAAMLRESSALQNITVPFARAESNSSNSGATFSSARTMMSTDPPSSAEGAPYQTGPYSTARPLNPQSRRHFVVRNGRTYLADPSVNYPLPVDLPELHRASMKTLLLFQLFGGPICAPCFKDRPPVRVLDVGCGSGFWSMMCHRYWAKRGHPNIQFTGIDIAPLAGASGWGPDDSAPSLSSASSLSDDTGPASLRPPDKDMKWRFVQHDLRKFPWPFSDGEFDLVMMQSLSMAAPLSLSPTLNSEVVRVLRPGGVFEIWETDHTIRMLRPHVPTVSAAALGGWSGAAAAAAAASASAGGSRRTADDDDDDDDDDGDSSSDDDDSDSDDGSDSGSEEATRLGAYVITSNTPMSSPLNNFLVEYNSWVTKALESHHLSPVPCTHISFLLLQEDQLTGVESRRMAVPLSEVKWEREGVGGVVTKDGKSYVSTTTKGLRVSGAQHQHQHQHQQQPGGGGDGEGGGGASKGRALSQGQAALRRTALMTVVQLIQSLEPVLREASGKSQDEWDTWQGKMQNDLLRENGTSWGECLEVGAWFAKRK